MNQSSGDDVWPTKEFFDNRNNFPPEEVEKYRGMYIAWSRADGRKILDSDESDRRLWDKLMAAGVDPQRTVIDFVDKYDILL